jgi:gentisate 1,2-dioxygenase
MATMDRPKTMSDLPAQEASTPATKAEKRARFFNSGNAFNIILPAVPNAVFADEPRRAMDPATPTGVINCDASDEMQCAFPATSPFLLARYARINTGESLSITPKTSGVVHYVIEGEGITEIAGEAISWKSGDVFVAPGGVEMVHTAGDMAAVLWVCGNEPQLNFENLEAPARGNSPTDLVHYTCAEIDRQIDQIYSFPHDEKEPGLALVFSSDKQQDGRNVLPTLTLAMNTLLAGAVQRPHRHNSVAVSLVIQGNKCFSQIDGVKKDWAPWATTITPPVSVHSHHNGGDERAMFLIVQDGGLFYHARAMGFEFVDV